MNILSLLNDHGQQYYILKEDDQVVLKLRYKNELHIARVEAGEERRVLTIEDEGLVRTKLILKNEYGVRIGSLSYDNFSDTHGTVDIEDLKYRFDVKYDASPWISICKGSRKNPVYSCQLQIDKNILKPAFAALLIAVSWYLFLKEGAKKDLEFHEAIIL